MTNQRDPNHPIPVRTEKRDESWSMLPIALVIAVLLGAGYMLYRNMEPNNTATPTRTTQTQPNNSIPAPSSTPTPMTPAPTTPKQP
jgi:hypothetical protein